MHRDAIARFSSLDEWGRRTYTYIHTHIYKCIELTKVWREGRAERERERDSWRYRTCTGQGERRVRLGRRAEAESGWVEDASLHKFRKYRVENRYPHRDYRWWLVGAA